MASAQHAEGEGPLAIVCGGGSLPLSVAKAVQGRGRRVVLFPVHGWADPAIGEGFPHYWLTLAKVNGFVSNARTEGCSDVVFIGTAVRPPFLSLRMDRLTLPVLSIMLRSYRGGDSHLFDGVATVFERYGFRILGAHQVAPEILMPEGAIGTVAPVARDRNDIARGLALLNAIGPFDVGQATIVADNHVLAVEGAEGTDAMLARITELRAKGRIATPRRVGVLVKAPKPDQDHRFDLPTIGPRTVEEVAQAGLAGIAVVAGSSIIAEPEQVAVAADKAGVFVLGLARNGP